MTKPTDSIRAEVSYPFLTIENGNGTAFMTTDYGMNGFNIDELTQIADKINRPDPLKIVEEMKNKPYVNITGKTFQYEEGYNYGFKIALEEVLKRLGGKQ